MISARVIADSKNEFGNRITTMVVTMPRIILAEFNTHRMFSRNSASSRAIPFEKMVKSVEENPFIPIAWQKDHKGMQGVEYCDNSDGGYTCMWLEARDKAVYYAKQLSYSTVTKQLCNRLLEPFMYHTVICTTTEWENFFALRCPQYCFSENQEIKWRSRKDVIEKFPLTKNHPNEWWRSINLGQAEIHMMSLAEAMWDAYNESIPKELKAGEWHIPFGDKISESELKEMFNHWYDSFASDNADYDFISMEREYIETNKVKIATARCAQVSYTVVGEDGKESSYENLIKLHDRLLKSGHMSPFEHCARAMSRDQFKCKLPIPKQHEHLHMEYSGNFCGFYQYRKMFENENIGLEKIAV